MAITDEQKSQLVRQFRFYFSNSNIMKDKFLLGKVKENPEGWVQLAVLCTFNRVKAITTDVAEVASALEGIEGLELNADKTSIRRKEPLPEKWTPDERTLYAKGVPEDEDIEVLEKFFSQYGKVLMVQKRRAPRAGDVKYKNSVHIEFETVEDMQKALAAKPVYKDVPLEVMTKEAHDAERGPKKGKPAKRERDEDEKEEGEAKKAKEEEEKEEPIVLPRGASILFTEVGTSDWKVIKGALKDTADVRFCVVQDDTAKVMFHSKEGAEKVIEKNKSEPFKFEEKAPAAVKLLEGEEEDSFVTAMEEKIRELKKASKKTPKGGKGGKKKKDE